MGYAYLFTAVLMLTVAPFMVFNMAEFMNMDTSAKYDSPADVINLFKTSESPTYDEDNVVWWSGTPIITADRVTDCAVLVAEYDIVPNFWNTLWMAFVGGDVYECMKDLGVVDYDVVTGTYDLNLQYGPWNANRDDEVDANSGLFGKIGAVIEFVIDYTFGLLLYLGSNVKESGSLLMAEPPDGFGVPAVVVFGFYTIWLIIILMFIIDTLKGSIPFT